MTIIPDLDHLRRAYAATSQAIATGGNFPLAGFMKHVADA